MADQMWFGTAGTSGSYGFARNPIGMNTINKTRYVSMVRTYSNVEVFSWGASLVGKQIQLHWDYMPPAMFDMIQYYVEADVEFVWDPTGNTGTSGVGTYDVQILSFEGEYFKRVPSSSGEQRKNVNLLLLITGVN
jgi:hypothetical protein